MAKTLIEAMALVVVVMFVFLQNWRATLFPTIAVPVVVLGTFGVLKAFGYSINTLTLFALVLVIGLLVDDAIVVVENVERIMTEEGLSPKEATKKSMDEITGALFGIAMVLTAVLAPMGFFGGSTGVIYRQFSVTMVSAILLSVLVALVLTPALTATLLKPHKPGRDPNKGLFGGFNRVFDSGVTRYERGLQGIIKRPWPLLALYGVILAAMVALFIRLPSGFLPDEDQGAILAQITLPVGAVATRTVEVQKKIEHQFLVNEKDNVEQFLTIQGFSFAGVGQNTGIAFAKLKDWDIRKGAARHAPAIAQRANRALSAVRDAQIFALVQPAVSELGNATGFDMELEDRGGLGHDRFLAARNQLLGMASQDPGLVAVRPNGQEDTPQFHVEVDNQKAGALGLAQADINTTLSGAWGGIYVNDFIDRDRVKHVYIQGDAPFRSKPEDLNAWAGAQQHRHHDAVLGLLLDRVDLRSLPAHPLQRPARLRNPGPAGAGPELGFGDRQDGGHGGQAAGRRRLRVDGPVLPGAGRPDRRRPCSTPSRSWWCSCAWRPFTKAGRSRPRCCSCCRWGSSAP